ncbi:MAG: hypothetical protein LBG05_09075 [Treponema sp.]|jgi:N-acylneuraminate cytidylyltransferase|nr:hypothetical protein [Treponema sp.]
MPSPIITAIIPVKKESGRLRNKNILPFADSNLLIHKIRQLKEVKAVSEIIVSSDSDAMLEMARNEGVVAMKRPIEFANESRSFSDFLEYICENTTGDHILWACVTSPLVDSNVYREGIEMYLQKREEGYDSLITVHRFQHFLLDGNGPLNFHRGKGHKNSQDLPPLFLFTNGIILAPRKNMYEWKYHFGINPFYLEVTKDAAIDIDDIYDYECALTFYNMNSRNK